MGSQSWIGRADLAALACPYCGRMADPNGEAAVAAEREWGFVGAGLALDGVRTAALLITPIPDTRAAMLSCLWVAPGQVGRGRGRRLVQAAAAGLLSHDVEAIVARGSRTKADCAAPPVDFLRAVGFSRGVDARLYSSLRAGGGAPRLGHPSDLDDARLSRLWQLDLTTTVTMPEGLRGMVDRWLRALGPIRPEPAGRVTRNGES
ncbi:MAG: hypothetical protein LCH76_12810 [Actinobacteria bacterium]|nr:hypothetical protein [Actinomycetota bacterium]